MAFWKYVTVHRTRYARHAMHWFWASQTATTRITARIVTTPWITQVSAPFRNVSLVNQSMSSARIAETSSGTFLLMTSSIVPLASTWWINPVHAKVCFAQFALQVMVFARHALSRLLCMRELERTMNAKTVNILWMRMGNAFSKVLASLAKRWRSNAKSAVQFYMVIFPSTQNVKEKAKPFNYLARFVGMPLILMVIAPMNSAWHAMCFLNHQAILCPNLQNRKR